MSILLKYPNTSIFPSSNYVKIPYYDIKETYKIFKDKTDADEFMKLLNQGKNVLMNVNLSENLHSNLIEFDIATGVRRYL